MPTKHNSYLTELLFVDNYIYGGSTEQQNSAQLVYIVRWVFGINVNLLLKY